MPPHCPETLQWADRFSATPEAVTGFLKQTRSRLKAHGHAAGADTAWELVLAEVLNNITEHAYASHAGTGVIRTELQFTETRMTARIRDTGHPMPQNRLPDGTDMPQPEDHPEGGFGWGLIHMLTDEIVYRRAQGENCLDLTLRLMP